MIVNSLDLTIEPDDAIQARPGPQGTIAVFIGHGTAGTSAMILGSRDLMDDLRDELARFLKETP